MFVDEFVGFEGDIEDTDDECRAAINMGRESNDKLLKVAQELQKDAAECKLGVKEEGVVFGP